MSKFINADCMDYLPTYPDNHFDLAIVDPPYGINLGHGTTGGGSQSSVRTDKADPSEEEKLIALMRGGDTPDTSLIKTHRGAKSCLCNQNFIPRSTTAPRRTSRISGSYRGCQNIRSSGAVTFSVIT